MRVNSLKAKFKQIKNLLPRKRTVSVLEKDDTGTLIIPEGVQVSKGVLLVPRRNMTPDEWQLFFIKSSKQVAHLKIPDDIASVLEKDQAIIDYKKHQERQDEQKNQKPVPVNPNFAESFKSGNTGRGTIVVRSL